MEFKVQVLEQRLFDLDRHYEEESARMMKEIQMKKEKEIAIFKDKMKQEYKYQMGIKLEMEKSKILKRRLKEVALNTEKSSKLSEMRLQMEQLRDAKEKLEIALQKSQAELTKIGEAKHENSPKWSFEDWGLLPRAAEKHIPATLMHGQRP